MASVFTLIMEGKIPGNFVWKDDKAVAILTIQPIRQGHVLVIPREEIDQWSDLPVALAEHVMQVSHKIANGLKVAYPATRVGLMIAGLEVPHTHVHLVPMDSMNDLSFAFAKNADAAVLKQTAEKIRSVLQQQGHAEASI
ncbi:HIT family protein [Cellvibrio japonicus]|uniref:HIT-like protein n=1 Tax=Cellvibrio japonicus (strain Ueda107) TaxID=498211 RepID=B3PHH6_CELJU|nr:HIT family protein [Cellvibrio japonicus]ACE85101.1 HIT-like protein [Cellvibrio japonicus Ueda107]QEI12454.1 HIT family protein [Cellvibrio japonicus]QEI16028.1 HIT family protein [Cellvibrio japonicus]QEI19606.1 HIT family protein [Cellvibrio japonicus]